MNTSFHQLFDPKKLLLIAGPCVLEEEAMVEKVASKLAEIQATYSTRLKVVFKTSFDKANRTCINNFRGVGLEKGLNVLARIKNEFGLPVLTDVHLPEQADSAGKVCDVLQIPAFLCRQTDLLLAAAQTGRTVNVKKGQFLSPSDMKFVVEKLEAHNASEIWQTERGTTFGYGNLVVDMRAFPIMKANGRPVLFDVTHSLQMPGMGIGTTGGDRRYAEPLAKAALAAGAQGLFIETHPEPHKALSDASTQIPLNDLEALIEVCLKVWQVVNGF